MAKELQEFEGYKGVWRTVGSRHIFIREGEDLPSAMKRSGKFNNNNNSQKSYNIISGDENDENLRESDKKAKQYYEEMKKNEDNLNKLSNDKKISDEEYEKKWLDNRHIYEDKIEDLRQKKIYDSRKDEVLYLEKSRKVTNENKRYTNQQKVELTEEESQALTDYTGSYTYGSSGYINRHLNDKETGLSASLKEKMESNIKNIDIAMSKNKIGGDYQFYRGIEPDKLGYPEIAEAITKINRGIDKGHMLSLRKQVEILENIKNKEIATKGFMSTSTYIDPNYTKRGITLVINSKKDDRAIDIRELSRYNGKRNTSYLPFYSGTVQTESEVLFDRDTGLIVKNYAVTEEGVFLFCDTKQKRKNN